VKLNQAVVKIYRYRISPTLTEDRYLMKSPTYKIPKKINIAGIPFSVKSGDPTMDPSEPLLGVCLSDTREIIISDALPENQDLVARVVLHEALHGLLAVTGLSTLLADETEEAIVTALESHLPELMRQVGKGWVI